MDKKDMVSAEEKREARFARWLSPKDPEGNDLRFKSGKAEDAYKRRVTRFKNTVLMEKVPDRIPIYPSGTFMQTDLNGVTPYESMYDYDKLLAAHKKFLVDYEPDYYGSPAFVGSGKILDIGQTTHKVPHAGIIF